LTGFAKAWRDLYLPREEDGVIAAEHLQALGVQPELPVLSDGLRLVWESYLEWKQYGSAACGVMKRIYAVLDHTIDGEANG
jgi:hypothetical protein